MVMHVKRQRYDKVHVIQAKNKIGGCHYDNEETNEWTEGRGWRGICCVCAHMRLTVLSGLGIYLKAI